MLYAPGSENMRDRISVQLTCPPAPLALMTSIRTSSILKRGVAVGASKERQQLESERKGVEMTKQRSRRSRHSPLPSSTSGSTRTDAVDWDAS